MADILPLFPVTNGEYSESKLLSLTNEVLLIVADSLQGPNGFNLKDLNSLAQTCKRLYTLPQYNPIIIQTI